MRQVTIETVVEVVKVPGEHLNFNASSGARTRIPPYDRFSTGMRTRHNRNGSASTTIPSKWYARVRCDDSIVYDLDIKQLAQGRRLTYAARNAIINDIEDYIVGMPIQLNDDGTIDYQELLKTLKARESASRTE